MFDSDSKATRTGPDQDSGTIEVDVAIAGSGFAGSLLAIILRQCGLRTLLFDRATHPRFAIGESSTPTANLILADLADRYGLDWLKPLAKAGSWHRTHRQLMFGLKRGFSYFRHTPGECFRPDHAHSRELLVMAAASDEQSDTHWLRSDVDAFLHAQAVRAGCLVREAVQVDPTGESALRRTVRGWSLRLSHVHQQGLVPSSTPAAGNSSADRPCDFETVAAKFLVDATGPGSLLLRSGVIADECRDITPELQTRSRAIYGHVRGLPRWGDALRADDASATRDYPFDCDDAALHHLLDEGWMWWLRFHNDITSVGLVLTGAGDEHATESALQNHAAESWHRVIQRYPSLANAFAGTEWMAPAGAPVGTPRLQRLVSSAAGHDWAMLPYTAGFIDPLHSTGIAHSLSAIERLVPILVDRFSGRLTSPAGLAAYSTAIVDELRHIDRLVSGFHAASASGCFEHAVVMSMAYFAAATTWERRRLQGSVSGFLLADDPRFVTAVTTLQQAATSLLRQSQSQSAFSTGGDDTDLAADDFINCSFINHCAELLAPYDTVGLFNPPRPHMYGDTALPE